MGIFIQAIVSLSCPISQPLLLRILQFFLGNQIFDRKKTVHQGCSPVNRVSIGGSFHSQESINLRHFSVGCGGENRGTGILHKSSVILGFSVRPIHTVKIGVLQLHFRKQRSRFLLSLQIICPIGGGHGGHRHICRSFYKAKSQQGIEKASWGKCFFLQHEKKVVQKAEEHTHIENRPVKALRRNQLLAQKRKNKAEEEGKTVVFFRIAFTLHHKLRPLGKEEENV